MRFAELCRQMDLEEAAKADDQDDDEDNDEDYDKETVEDDDQGDENIESVSNIPLLYLATLLRPFSASLCYCSTCSVNLFLAQ